jgi:hypothetical protein
MFRAKGGPTQEGDILSKSIVLIIFWQGSSLDAISQSGTLRFSGPCQPALSSCSTIRLVKPAPTFLAKSARISSNISLLIAVATFHIVLPLAGSTKPVTYSYSKRCWPKAMGRSPFLAQMRRTMGFRPMRCSSTVHSSTAAWGYLSFSALTAFASFF